MRTPQKFLSYDLANDLADKLKKQLKELQTLTNLDDNLLSLDLVNYLLQRDFIRKKPLIKMPGVRHFKEFDHSRVDWMVKKLKGKDLRSTDFRGAYLIGADLRVVNFSGANLSYSMFLN